MQSVHYVFTIISKFSPHLDMLVYTNYVEACHNIVRSTTANPFHQTFDYIKKVFSCILLQNHPCLLLVIPSSSCNLSSHHFFQYKKEAVAGGAPIKLSNVEVNTGVESSRAYTAPCSILMLFDLTTPSRIAPSLFQLPSS